MLSTVRNLAFFCAARARVTSCHLLYLDHVAVSRIGKAQYCFPGRQPKQGYPGQLLFRPRAARLQPPRQNVHSRHTRPRALYKSLESCRLRYGALSRPVRPPAFHLGLKLRERLQTPMQGCSQRSYSLVALPALPATARYLLLRAPAESRLFPECCAPPHSQVLTLGICDNEPSLRTPVLFSAEPSRDCREPVRSQDADPRLLAASKWPRPVVPCPRK